MEAAVRADTLLAGRVAVVGGCREYTGAPFFAAMAALRVRERVLRRAEREGTTAGSIPCTLYLNNPPKTSLPPHRPAPTSPTCLPRPARPQ